MAHISLGGEEGLLTVRVTATGLIYTGPCLICWITVHPSTTGWEFTISDGVATGTDKWCIGNAVEAGIHCNFSKPMKMETGIYVEDATSIEHATIGYAPVHD